MAAAVALGALDVPGLSEQERDVLHALAPERLPRSTVSDEDEDRSALAVLNPLLVGGADARARR